MRERLVNPAYALNGQTVSSAQFYAVACDSRRSVVVEACAGAGKTWMLISRIVDALEKGAEPEQILAITFTRKAAGEMRERLHQRLDEPQHHALRQRLLANGRAVNIQTFHAWFSQLLQATPMAVFAHLGLPLAYELLEDSATLLPDLRHAFYQRVRGDAQGYADLQALVDANGRHQTFAALENLLSKRVEFELADRTGVLEPSVLAADAVYPAYRATLQNRDAAGGDWLHSKPDDYAKLQQLAKVLGSYGKKTLDEAASRLEAGLTAADCSQVTHALLTQKGEPKRFAVKMEDSHRALLEQAQAYVLEILQVQHQHECWLYHQRLVRLGRVWLAEFAKLKRVRQWVDMSDLESAAHTLLSDPEVSGAVQERLDLRLRHVMIDEFQDTNPLQWQALHAWLEGYAGSGGGQLRPSLFIVGDPKQSIYRFRRAEPRVFAAATQFLQESFAADVLRCDHTRRNAQAVLDVVNAAMSQAVAAQQYSNFRTHTTGSDQEGQAWYLPMIERPDKAVRAAAAVGGEAGHSDKHSDRHSGEASNTDEAWRDSLTDSKGEDEERHGAREVAQVAQWIARQVQQPPAGNAPGTIMVLCRRHEPLAHLQAALQEWGIVAQKQEKNDLSTHPAVLDVLALLNALVSPQKNLGLAQALKSPLFGWRDEDLLALRLQQTDPSSPWLDLLPEHPRTQLLRWRQWLQQLPPHDALQAIYDDGAVLQRYAAQTPESMRQSCVLALQALLGEALQVDGGRYPSAYRFVRALRAQAQTALVPEALAPEESPAPASPQAVRAAPSVQLLTIHGAKGLEADTVVLLDTDSAAPKSQTMTTLIDWQPESASPRRFVFLQSESAPPTCARALLEEDRRSREVEEINALYVAATRARQTLVLSANRAFRSNPHSLWARLQPHCQALLPEEGADDAAERPMLANLPSPSPLALPWVVGLERVHLSALGWLATQPEPSQQHAPHTQRVIPMGLALHRLLQWLPTADALPSPAWGAHAFHAVAEEFGLDAQELAHVQTMAQAVVQKQAWLWQRAAVDWSASEYELYWQGHLLRVDRLVKRRDTQQWWIVDYKTALRPQESEALRLQLQTYALAVSAAFDVPQTAIQLAFINAEGELLPIAVPSAESPLV